MLSELRPINRYYSQTSLASSGELGIDEMIKLKCNSCLNEIQADESLAGEFAQCPLCGNVVAVSDPFPPLGTEISGYVIESILSNNLLRNLYLASNAARPIPSPSGRAVLSIPSAFFLKRVTNYDVFAAALVKSGSLNIAGTPTLFDYSQPNGHPYFAFILPATSNLEIYLTATGPLPLPNALRIVLSCAVILKDTWNNHKLIHQNLTPANIEITSQQNVTLIDIGVSQTLRSDENLLNSGFNIWDNRYMSPELALYGDGQSSSCDIYALGMTLFFLVTGKAPFDNNLNQTSILATPPPDLRSAIPQCPGDVATLFLMMTDRDPKRRFGNWNEVAKNIEFILSAPQPPPAPPHQQSQTEAYPSPHPSPHPSLTDTVDRIVKRGSGTEKNRRLQKLKVKNKEETFIERNIGLVLTLFVLFLLGVPLVAYWMHTQKKSKKIKHAVAVTATAPATPRAQASSTSSSNPKTPAQSQINTIATADPQSPPTMTPPNIDNDKSLPPSDEKNNSLPKTEGEKSINSRLRDIGKFFKANPDAAGVAMKRYEVLSEEARKLKRLDIVDKIQKIRNNLPHSETADSGVEATDKLSLKVQKNDTEPSSGNPAIDSVMGEIRRKVKKLIKIKDYDNAMWFVEEYSGAYCDETQKQRRALIKKIKELKKNDPEAKKSEIADTGKNDFDSGIEITPSTKRDEPEASEAEDTEFVKELSALLNRHSLDYNSKAPKKLLIQLIKTKIARKNAVKLAAELEKLVNQAKKSDFTPKNSEVLNALRLFCIRNAGPSIGEQFKLTPPKFVSSDDNLADFLNSANDGDRIKLGSGTFTLESVDISKDNITLTAAPDTLLEGGDFMLTGSNCAMIGIRFKDSDIRVFSSKNSSMRNCVLENTKLKLVKSNNFKMSNTFLVSATLDKSNGFKANHCTFASTDEARPALKVDTDNLFITNSILYSKGYAVLVTQKRTNKKCFVTYSMIFGDKGFCVRESDELEPKKGDLALKKTKVKLFLKVKHNIYSDPPFRNSWKGDWRLEEDEPGTKGASDKKECGVIWP